MGDIKKRKRKFDKPRKRWDKPRIEAEREIKKKYGLKNKKELWRTETILRKKKKDARKLFILELEERLKREKELINSLAKYALFDEKAALDDILSLQTESLLERRLQTLVWRKGLSGTIDQARQFIVHGHIAINGKKVTIPGYLVRKDEEDKIGYYGKPMVVEEKKKREIKKEISDKKKLAQEFENAKPEGAEETKEEEDAEIAEELKEEDNEITEQNIEEQEAEHEEAEERKEKGKTEEEDGE